MLLTDAILQLDALPEDAFICVRRPWNSEAVVLIVPYSSDLRIPAEVTAQGFEYFLEVSTVREILEEFLKHKPSLHQITDFILFYAENDAYPVWANELCEK
jgi:hypothetical protein